VVGSGVPKQMIAAPDQSKFIEFSAQTRMSGIDLTDGRQIRKGAPDAVAAHLRRPGETPPAGIEMLVTKAAAEGATPLLVADGRRLLGAVVLQDTLKPKISERVAQLRQMGLRTIMITGDNKLTAATIAHRAGVDDFLAEQRRSESSNFCARSRQKASSWR